MKREASAATSLLAWTMTGLSLAAIAVGGANFWRFDNTPGAKPEPAPEWPATSRLRLDSDRCTLVLFAHPHCPCTRASINSLDEIMKRCGDRLTAYVQFVRPQPCPTDWERTELWDSAAAIPGVTAIVDKGGKEARLFHAKTSGHAFLYDCHGHLCFSGGITPARGHVGPCSAQEAVIDAVTHSVHGPKHFPVFGCPLLSE
jgi:hypothetical protein